MLVEESRRQVHKVDWAVTPASACSVSGKFEQNSATCSKESSGCGDLRAFQVFKGQAKRPAALALQVNRRQLSM